MHVDDVHGTKKEAGIALTAFVTEVERQRLG
jgi:hypothetical protein